MTVVGLGPGIGLYEAGTRSGHVMGIGPSEVMRDAATRHAELIGRAGCASMPAWRARFTELHRVMCLDAVSRWPSVIALSYCLPPGLRVGVRGVIIRGFGQV